MSGSTAFRPSTSRPDRTSSSSRAGPKRGLEDRVIPTIGLNAVAGKEPEDFGLDPVRFDEMLPGCYDVGARLADMDLDGVHAQMCFPSFPGFCGGTLLAAEDKELATPCVVAWNDFILDEWSAAAPDRFIPMVMVPFWDVAASVAEVERTAAKGPRPSPSPRHRTGSACPRTTATTGTPSSPRPRRRTCRSVCTSEPAAHRSGHPTPTSPSPSRSSA